MAISVGQITITDVQDGSTLVEQYVANTTPSQAPAAGAGWSSVIPPSQEGAYIWKRQRREHANGSNDAWSTPVRVTGAPGPQGIPGGPGGKGDPGEKGDTGEAGTPAPRYLNTRNSLPETEGSITGDFFLAGSTFTAGETTYKVATLWEYNGSAWAPCTDGSKAMLAMDDYAMIAAQAEDGVFNQVVAKRFIAMEANIQELMTKILQLQEGGRIESANYNPGKKGFQLLANGIINAIEANLIDCNIDGTGTFRGIIDSDPIKTTTESAAADPVVFNPKTHWWQSDLNDQLGAYALNTVHNVTGTLDGESVTAFLRANGDTTAIYKDVSINKAPLPPQSYTVQGAGTIDIALQCIKAGWNPYYPAGEIIERPSPLLVIINGVEKLNYTGYTLTTYPFDVVAGDVVECKTQEIGRVVGFSGTAKCKITQSFNGAGTHLVRNGVWDLIPTRIYSTRALVLDGLFSSSSSTWKKYAKGDSFVAGVQAYPVNELKAAQGTFTYNGTPYQVTGISRTSIGMAIYHAGGFIPISAALDAYSGYYIASGSYAVVASVAGAEMMNINAKARDVYSIGLATRFLQIIAKNLIGENVTGTLVTGTTVDAGTLTADQVTATVINAQNTTNKVWGAVAN